MGWADSLAAANDRPAAAASITGAANVEAFCSMVCVPAWLGSASKPFERDHWSASERNHTGSPERSNVVLLEADCGPLEGDGTTGESVPRPEVVACPCMLRLGPTALGVPDAGHRRGAESGARWRDTLRRSGAELLLRGRPDSGPAAAELADGLDDSGGDAWRLQRSEVGVNAGSEPVRVSARDMKERRVVGSP